MAQSTMATALIVDDAGPIRKLMTAILKREGHTVHQATDGQAALRIAREHKLDIALVDYWMPGITGLEVLARLRQVQPSTARLLVSGGLDLDATIGAVNEGEVARVLQKPFTPTELVAAVNEALAQRDRLAAAYEHERSTSRAQHASYLDECFSGELLHLALQPIVAANDGSPVAFEALLRSAHPILNGPGPLLRVAEEAHRLHILGGEVGRLAAKWMPLIPDEVRLFVNLHPDELGQPAQLWRTLQPLHRFAKRVVLEITERSDLRDLPAWRESVNMLAETGYSVAADDLGAGYSSLAMLAELKPQFMKIDMSIVRNLHQDEHKRRLVSLLCQFAQATGARVVAEGIEVQEEAETAIECGAHALQGFYFGHPSECLDVSAFSGGRDCAV